MQIFVVWGHDMVVETRALFCSATFTRVLKLYELFSYEQRFVNIILAGGAAVCRESGVIQTGR